MRGFILLNFRTAKFSTRELRVSVPFRGFMLDNGIKWLAIMLFKVSVPLQGFMLDNDEKVACVDITEFLFPSPCGVSC